MYLTLIWKNMEMYHWKVLRGTKKRFTAKTLFERKIRKIQVLKHGQRDLLCVHLVLYYSVNTVQEDTALFQDKSEDVCLFQYLRVAS